jgi:hypothetical protein
MQQHLPFGIIYDFGTDTKLYMNIAAKVVVMKSGSYGFNALGDQCRRYAKTIYG